MRPAPRARPHDPHDAKVPMAGHSKFKNIMHRKGAQDKKRSAMFSKLSREITVAAKSGMPDPDMNPRLRLAVNNAKAQSMPKDNIQRAIDKLDLGPWWLLAIVVVLPIGEELTFRAWLSGRPGHVTAIVVLLAAAALAVLSTPQAYPILALGSLAIGIGLALGLLFWLRHRPPFPFFSRHFGWFYFIGALLFAAAHLGNYEGAALVLLPLVVPQLLVGLILGYARVTYGLWSDILLHMLHNGLLIGLVVLGKGFAG